MSDTLIADPRQNEMFENPVPAAVRRQGQRADELMRAAQAQAAGATGEGEAAPEAPPAEGQANTTPVVTPAEPRPAPEAPPAERRAERTDDWEQRFRSLQGRFDSQIPELTARARAAEAQVAQLNGLVAELRMQMTNLRQSPPASAPAASVEIPQADIEAYGSELVESSRRWARSEFAPEIERMRRESEQVRQEMAQLRGQTQSTQSELAQERVHAGLDEQLPGWRATNSDPGFLAWLAETDPFSGRPRQAMLGEAYTGGNVARVVAFFRAYDREHTATNPQAARDTPTHTSAQAGAGTVPLADLAAPGRGRPMSPGAPAEKRIWSRKDITAFYQDAALGKYDGNPALKAQLDADINAAALEGRIR